MAMKEMRRMQKIKKTRSSKGILLTLLMVVLFVLMIGEVVTYVLISTDYNTLAQSAGAATNQGSAKTIIVQSASSLLQSSLSRSMTVLNYLESTPGLRKTLFINNSRQMLASLMMNGTVYRTNLAGYMGSAMIGNLSNAISANLGQQGTTVTLQGGALNIFQNTSDSLRATYSALAIINTTTGSFTTPIFVTASAPLNGTPDVLLGEQQQSQTISVAQGYPKAVLISNTLAFAGSNSVFMFVSGTAVFVGGSPGCTAGTGNVPARFENANFILVTPNAMNINSIDCGMGGLVTNVISSPPPLVPYLVYNSQADIFNSILNGTQITIDGPAHELLNMSPLQYAIQNNLYYASPFLPSYLERLQGSSARSGSGIFSFAALNRQAAYFTDAATTAPTSNVFVTAANAPVLPGSFTVSFWMDGNQEQYDCAGLISDTGTSNFLISVLPAGGTCTGGSATATDMELSFRYTNTAGSTTTHNTPLIDAQAWKNIALTFGSNVLTWYINGNKAASFNALVNLNPTNGNLVIGAGVSSGSYSFNGAITNLQVYNSVLPAQLIQNIYLHGAGGAPNATNTLSAWYPLINNATDYSGYAHNGIASNVIYKLMAGYSADPIYSSTYSQYNASPVVGVLNCGNPTQCSNLSQQHLYLGSGPLSIQSNTVLNESATLGDGLVMMPRVARFDSALNEYVNQTIPLGWLSSASNAFTFSIWVYPTDADGVIIDELAPSSTTNDAMLSLVSGTLEINYLGGSSCRSLGAIPLNAWSNVVFTFDGTQTITGWVNGVETLMPTTNGARTAPSASSDYVLGGGKPSTNCGTAAYFSGMMSDYQVYNSALPAAAINRLYLNNTVNSIIQPGLTMPLSNPYQSNLNTTIATVATANNLIGIFWANGKQCTVANAALGSCVTYAAP